MWKNFFTRNIGKNYKCLMHNVFEIKIAVLGEYFLFLVTFDNVFLLVGAKCQNY